jgi:hypothetical protein
MCDAVGRASDFDEGFDYPGTAAKVRLEASLELFQVFASGFVYLEEAVTGSACFWVSASARVARLSRSSTAIWAIV